MIFWNVAEIERHMTRRGWANARQLALGAGISYPAAWAVGQGAALGRIDTGTLRALARAFGLKPPRAWTLLEWTPDE